MQNITNAAELKNAIQLLQEEELIKRQTFARAIENYFRKLKAN